MAATEQVIVDELAAAQAQFEAAQADFNVKQTALEDARRSQASALHRLNEARLEKLRVDGRNLQDEAAKKTDEYRKLLREIEDWKVALHQAEKAIDVFEAKPAPEFPTRAERVQREAQLDKLQAARQTLFDDPERIARGNRYNVLRQELLVLDEKLKSVKGAIINLEHVVSGRGIGKFSDFPTTTEGMGIASIG